MCCSIARRMHAVDSCPCCFWAHSINGHCHAGTICGYCCLCCSLFSVFGLQLFASLPLPLHPSEHSPTNHIGHKFPRICQSPWPHGSTCQLKPTPKTTYATTACMQTGCSQSDSSTNELKNCMRPCMPSLTNSRIRSRSISAQWCMSMETDGDTDSRATRAAIILDRRS